MGRRNLSTREMIQAWKAAECPPCPACNVAMRAKAQLGVSTVRVGCPVCLAMALGTGDVDAWRKVAIGLAKHAMNPAAELDSPHDWRRRALWSARDLVEGAREMAEALDGEDRYDPPVLPAPAASTRGTAPPPRFRKHVERSEPREPTARELELARAGKRAAVTSNPHSSEPWPSPPNPKWPSNPYPRERREG